MNIEQGSLRENSAGALLLKIFELQKTGVLYLKRDEILKELYIERGKLIWTASNSEVDTLSNMLILQKKLPKESIEEVKKDTKNEIELGKLLVGNGTITLDELIEFSKVQMRKIVKSVLKWSDGVYYFSKDVPANAFINLEIDLKDFVYNFVKFDLDMGFIWKGIGSFQEIFFKTGDDKKIEKYNLSKEELELLDKFTGEVNVEVISLNFVGLPKEEILKIIYFFLLSELLVKKEDFEEEKFSIPDMLINKEENKDKDQETDIGEIGQIDLEEIDNINSPGGVDIKMNSANEPDHPIISPEDEIPVSPHKDISITDKMLMDLKKENSGKKSKLLNYFLYFVVIALIAGGAIFIYLNNADDGVIESKKNTNDINLKKKNMISVKSIQKKTIDKKSSNSEKIQNSDAGNKKNLKSSKKNQKKIDNSLNKRGSKVIKKQKKTENPVEFMRKGNFRKAAVLWKNELLGSGFSYSILLELDCVKESVKFAYKKIVRKNNFALIEITRNGRSCYLVLYGKFRNETEAKNAIRYLPSYFLNQNNPPRVLELKKYL